MEMQSAQPAGTSDAGVLICVPRFSPLPVMAAVNPTAGAGAVPGQCEEAAATGKQLAASPSPPRLKWGLGPELGTAAPSAASAGSSLSKWPRSAGLGRSGPAPSQRG